MRTIPLYADFPWERNGSGQLVQNQAVWNKFLERDVLRRLSKNVEALLSMQAIYVDCGTSDQFNFIVDARRVHDELQRLNIPHHYSEFAGGHVTNLMASTGDALARDKTALAMAIFFKGLRLHWTSRLPVFLPANCSPAVFFLWKAMAA